MGHHMAVKAFNIVLVLTRVLALGFILYWVYVFFIAATSGGPAMGGDFAKMANFAKNQAMAAAGKSILMGLAVYFLAPYLAWAATRGMKKKDGVEFGEYS
jgi:hypothetical protein